jgi:hypothetical protein
MNIGEAITDEAALDMILNDQLKKTLPLIRKKSKEHQLTLDQKLVKKSSLDLFEEKYGTL